MYLEKVNDFIEENSFLNETVEQLEKDFLMEGVNFDVSKPVLNYSSLFNFTLHLIDALNEKDSQKILNLLYRIDLSEEFVQVQMKETEYSFTEMLSELIVKRELYKVVLRKNRFYLSTSYPNSLVLSFLFFGSNNLELLSVLQGFLAFFGKPKLHD